MYIGVRSGVAVPLYVLPPVMGSYGMLRRLAGGRLVRSVLMGLHGDVRLVPTEKSEH